MVEVGDVDVEHFEEGDSASLVVDACAGEVVGGECAEPGGGEGAVGGEEGMDVGEARFARAEACDEGGFVVGDEQREVLGGDSAHAVCGGEVAVEEVNDDFADAPGAGGDAGVELGGGEALGEGGEVAAALFVAVDELGGVGGVGVCHGVVGEGDEGEVVNALNGMGACGAR